MTDDDIPFDLHPLDRCARFTDTAKSAVAIIVLAVLGVALGVGAYIAVIGV